MGSRIFNSDWTKPNKLLLKVAENRSKNSKPECENSRTSLMLNNEEPLIPSKTPERLNERSRKSLTKPRRTKRTCLESKTWLTNSRLKSRPTNDKPRSELIWPNLPSTNSELKPEVNKQYALGYRKV